MSDQARDAKNARRNLLKSLVAGGGVLATGKLLPESWFRPVVKSVVLPAHAQVSPSSFDGVYRFDNGGAGMGDAGTPGGSILDMFVSPAHAQVGCPNVSSVQFSINGSMVQVCLTVGDSDSETTSVDPDTGDLGDVTMTVDSFNFNLFDMQVDSGASRIDGDSSCGLFTANRTSIPFSCVGSPNTNASMYLSSPYRDKA